MINKVNYKDEPSLFDDLQEFSIDNTMDHRRGASFYRVDIIELKPEDKKFFPEIGNFEQYVGTWRTDEIVWSDDEGFDETFSEIERVEKVEVVSYEWKNV